MPISHLHKEFLPAAHGAPPSLRRQGRSTVSERMPADSLLLSVIIPAYNYARLLPRALASVMSQADLRVELIVVDDGSSDDTPALLREAQTLYGPSLIVLQQANAGAASARNHGLRTCRGRHVLFLDADDELLPNAVATVLDILAARPSLDLLLGGNIKCDPDGREKRFMPGSLARQPRQRLKDYLLFKRIAIGHGYMVASRRMLQTRWYPEHFRCNEDVPVFAYLLAHGQVASVPFALARIHKHPGSLRHQLAADQEMDLQLVDEVFMGLPENCLDLRSRYCAQRSLSLFRSACLAGKRDAARGYYRRALSQDLRQALRLTYLKKALRLWLAR
ncbi:MULTISPECIES: glycosyltransferase family 2 protein [unclassified Pseudomonas]|uniref:glycosyltransferase family 2 protein n=1 Tax=unclassified Pseudomonas TaxID=196821 RepID=UPI001CE1DE19|nr:MULTISPECIES: glycosyltransferase family 2 protein [unclassified Pseudomonas]